MRHRKTVKKLGMTAAHRKSTLANLAASLFENKHVTTTEAKAKATKIFAERLITLAKKGTLHSRRLALSRLRRKNAVGKLFDEVVPQYKDRPGGYTRVIKLGQRSGDGARMAVVELVGFETASKKKHEKDKAKEAKAETKKKKRGKESEEGIEETPAKGKKTPPKPVEKEEKSEDKKESKKEKEKNKKKEKLEKKSEDKKKKKNR